MSRSNRRVWLRQGAVFPLLVLMPFAVGPVQAQTYSVLHNFVGGVHDGANPQGALIENAEHQFYGVSNAGGRYGYGTVFRLGKAGKSSLLHSFAYYNGYEPVAGIVEGADGNLYGTTRYGGYGFGTDSGDAGVLFELDNKKAKLLYQFSVDNGGQNDPDGVTADAQGNLYGVATGGGTYSAGYIYEFDTSGSLSVLYTFTGGSDGTAPQGPLAWGPDGDLYGVTQKGGANGAGTVFRMDTSGNLTTLYAFVRGTTDGYSPNPGTLAFDAAGNIYGTTQYGGTGTVCRNDCGTVFEVTPAGDENILYSFQGGTDGGDPLTGVVVDSAGNIYGTATHYGDQTCACGVLFSLDGKGDQTVLHSWTGPDGSFPSGQLLLSGSKLYGLTSNGGTSNDGVAFRWSPKQPVVKSQTQ